MRLAADTSDFAAYIMAQGGPFTPRRDLVVRVASAADTELNPYGEEVQKVTGIYSPLCGPDKVYCTRATKWKIVPKSLALDPLTLSSAAPRSSVNNCGSDDSVTDAGNPSEPLIIDWTNTPKVRAVVARLKKDKPPSIRRRYEGRRFAENVDIDTQPWIAGIKPILKSALNTQMVSDDDVYIHALLRGSSVKLDDDWRFVLRHGNEVIMKRIDKYCGNCCCKLDYDNPAIGNGCRHCLQKGLICEIS